MVDHAVLTIVDATIAAERHHCQAFGALAAPLEAHAGPPVKKTLGMDRKWGNPHG